MAWLNHRQLRWWQDKNPNQEPPSAISSHAVSVTEIEEVLESQGTVCKPGDIFILRTGFVKWHKYDILCIFGASTADFC